MIALRALRATGAPFPPFPPLKTLCHADWGSEPRFLRQNIDLAARKGDQELERALRVCLRKNERVRLFKEMDRVLLGGMVKRISGKFAGTPVEARRITTTPPKC